jgi:CheY-like chemotaxis protein
VSRVSANRVGAYRDVVDDLYQSRNAWRPAWSELSLVVDGRYGRAMALRDPRGLVLFVICRREVGVPRGPLVAIVDDDESMRDTTKDLLESAGFSAAAFARAASFLNFRRLSRVSCLIADMCMGEMIRLELHQHLVASNHPNPTILMAAYPDERVRAQAIRANVVCYLAKPPGVFLPYLMTNTIGSGSRLLLY